MRPKRRRLVFLIAGLVFLGVAATLVLNAFQDSIVFFLSPSELVEKPVPPDRAIRLGGLVEPGSLERDGTVVRFKITDLKRDIQVAYSGILPDLFREGQGVVCEGKLLPDGSFAAASVLAKHDERYMPPEVAAALKKSGRWREGAKQ